MEYRNFLELSYDELEKLNLEAKQKVSAHTPDAELRDYYLKYLSSENALKAVTVCFSDLEGRFHMLDYDKKFLVKSYDNLTFDGSSIRGFSVVRESDLRLEIDWGSFRWMPVDVFGPGKVMVFALIRDKDGSVYGSDFRGMLKDLSDKLWKKDKTVANVAVEIEGFLFDGINVEQTYDAREGFAFVATGGYYSALPKDPLRIFIDRFAEAQRALGFENEKDHPEVAPSQFELNYSYTDALLAADQIQLYKFLARQIANNMGMTACFLPKPVAGINGSGMHTNISVSRDGKNLMWDAKGEEKLSAFGWEFIDRVLNNAYDLCLVLNPSVNAYRRLDPNYEAPNQIMASAVDRTSMVRIPLGNEKSARVEVRTVAPDANPYLTIYSLFRTGLEGPIKEKMDMSARKAGVKKLPDNIQTAINDFKNSAYVGEMIGVENQSKFAELKQAAADRCPKELGKTVKEFEVIYHHEVQNQMIWKSF